MIKLILFLTIIFYLIYKIGSFFFKAGAASQQYRFQQKNQKNGAAGSADKSKSGGIKGGEYIDYEEIK